MSNISSTQTTPFSRQSGHVEILFSSEHTLTFADKKQKAQLEITYAPDRLLLETQDFQPFIDEHLKQDWATPENLLDSLVAALYDLLVPYSITAHLSLEGGNTRQRITASKNQPGSSQGSSQK